MPIVGIFIGLGVLLLIGKILVLPLKVLWKLLINGAMGAILLFIVNAVGHTFGLNIEITMITALVAGFFGVPGVIALLIFS